MHREEFFNQLPGREISELCYRFRKLRKLNLASLRYTLILKISIIKKIYMTWQNAIHCSQLHLIHVQRARHCHGNIALHVPLPESKQYIFLQILFLVCGRNIEKGDDDFLS